MTSNAFHLPSVEKIAEGTQNHGGFLMNALMRLLFAAAILTCFGLGSSATAQGTPNPGLTTAPNPAPADREFAAIFHIMANPGRAGFWGEQYPRRVVNGNVITYSFDLGCGWLCPPGEPTYTANPFTMPALPAGTYMVRFAEGLDASSTVLAEFTLNVGLGGVVSTPLPVDGAASALLCLLILLLGWHRLHARVDNNETVA